MKQILYAVFTRRGYDRVLQREPESTRGEYVVKLVIDVPDEVFSKQPIPVVEVKLTSRQVQVADVTVDGEDVVYTADEAAMKQSIVQKNFADLFAKARSSSDPYMQDAATMALDSLIRAGVDVRIVEELESEESGDGS